MKAPLDVLEMRFLELIKERNNQIHAWAHYVFLWRFQLKRGKITLKENVDLLAQHSAHYPYKKLCKYSMVFGYPAPIPAWVFLIFEKFRTKITNNVLWNSHITRLPTGAVCLALQQVYNDTTKDKLGTQLRYILDNLALYTNPPEPPQPPHPPESTMARLIAEWEKWVTAADMMATTQPMNTAVPSAETTTTPFHVSTVFPTAPTQHNLNHINGVNVNPQHQPTTAPVGGYHNLPGFEDVERIANKYCADPVQEPLFGQYGFNGIGLEADGVSSTTPMDSVSSACCADYSLPPPSPPALSLHHPNTNNEQGRQSPSAGSVLSLSELPPYSPFMEDDQQQQQHNPLVEDTIISPHSSFASHCVDDHWIQQQPQDMDDDILCFSPLPHIDSRGRPPSPSSRCRPQKKQRRCSTPLSTTTNGQLVRYQGGGGGHHQHERMYSQPSNTSNGTPHRWMRVQQVMDKWLMFNAPLGPGALSYTNPQLDALLNFMKACGCLVGGGDTYYGGASSTILLGAPPTSLASITSHAPTTTTTTTATTTTTPTSSTVQANGTHKQSPDTGSMNMESNNNSPPHTPPSPTSMEYITTAAAAAAATQQHPITTSTTSSPRGENGGCFTNVDFVANAGNQLSLSYYRPCATEAEFQARRMALFASITPQTQHVLFPQITPERQRDPSPLIGRPTSLLIDTGVQPLEVDMQGEPISPTLSLTLSTPTDQYCKPSFGDLLSSPATPPTTSIPISWLDEQ